MAEASYPIIPETSVAINRSMGFKDEWYKGKYTVIERKISGAIGFDEPKILFQRKDDA